MQTSKTLLVLIVMTFIFSCSKKESFEKPSEQKNATADFASEKKTLNAIGTWGINSNENANFEITSDSIYYPDAEQKLSYSITDSVLVVFDSNGDTSFSSYVSKLTSDSLVLINQQSSDTSEFVKLN
jgi:hypothetical protein